MNSIKKTVVGLTIALVSAGACRSGDRSPPVAKVTKAAKAKSVKGPVVTSKVTQAVKKLNSPFRARLLPKKVFMVGEPLYIKLILHNITDVDLQITEGGNQRNRLGRFDDYKIVVTDEKGAPLPVLDSSPGFGGITWAPKVPAKGDYVRELFLPNWVRLKRPGHYTITCSRNYKTRRFAKNSWVGKVGKNHLVSASAEVQVIPRDEATMGALIDRLGQEMLSQKNDQRERSIKRLSVVDDRRVIPWYLKALKTRSYRLKIAALFALGRLDEEQALQGIKLGMKTTGAQISNCTTTKIAAELADGVRLTAAQSLAESKVPGAWNHLLSMSKDSNYSVRLTVLHALARRKTAASRKRIEAMLRDKHKVVRGEARRYLNELK